MSYNEITVFTDGGSRGNPGPAAIGVYVVSQDGLELEKHSKCIGKATNNVAEYTAVIEAIGVIKNLEPQDVLFKLDSELVVKQLNGEYKVKDIALRRLYFDIKSLLEDLGARVKFVHVRREANKVADELVNIELDKQLIS